MSGSSEWRGWPSTTAALLAWAETRRIRIEHIQPGKPKQNAYVERYNHTVRYDWLASICSIRSMKSAGIDHLQVMAIQSRTAEHGARGITFMQKFNLAA